jgi:phosphoethanolamine N-methyltransferase
MSHQDEYHDAMVRMLELIWGEGYMAPGGADNVARMLEGIETRGKRVLDIGSGIGGPAREIATTHGAQVTGIDLEAPLVERANADARKAALDTQCSFQVVEPGPLPFDDETFDIVISAGAITQTGDKPALLAEAHRVLRPGGWLSIYEWMKSEGEYSDDMRYWFDMEGLTYAMVTIEEQAALIRDAGFTEVAAEDATDWYRDEARREYELIRGGLYDTLVESLGQADADHFVENWRAMVVVIDKGEMRQAYCRGRKPG